MSNTIRKKVESRKYNRILMKIKRYYYYEKKTTSKLCIKNKEAESIFMSDFNLECDGSVKKFIIDLHESKTNKVLMRRTIRKPRNKKDLRSKYNNYLQSSKWKKIREMLFDLRGRLCEDCGTPNKLHVHHLHYNTFGNENLEDLKILCKNCHEKEHVRINNEKAKSIFKNNSDVELYKRKGKLILKQI